MNTSPEPIPAYISLYFKISLPAFLSADPETVKAWGNFIAQNLTAELKSRNLLYAPPSFKKECALAIARGNEIFGVFTVTEWRIAYLCALAEINARKVLRFSKVGLHHSHENVLRIIYPKPAEEPIRPLIDFI